MTQVARSQTLIAVASTGAGYPAAFSCPAGHVLLVKAAHLTNSTLAAIRCVLLAIGAGAGQQANLFDIQLGAGASYYWAGWAAVNPGGYIQVYAGAAGVGFWVSGATLTGGPQFPINAAVFAEQQPAELPPPPGVGFPVG